MSESATTVHAGVRSAALPAPSATIAIVVITHNRAETLRACVENVLDRTSPSTTEILIWNNASTDATKTYLETLSDPRLKIIHHSENIGLNAYAEGFAQTSASYLVELDDDVTNAPGHWDRMLLEAFERIPRIGFLAADLEENQDDVPSRLRHEDCAHLYREDVVSGIRLLDGPTGGACAMTSREVYEQVGGFPQHARKFYFQEDATYITRIERLGYRKAILAGLRVHHTGGRYNGGAPLKDEYWSNYWRTLKRRHAVKKALLRIPAVPRLNASFRWFEPPDWEAKALRSQEKLAKDGELKD